MKAASLVAGDDGQQERVQRFMEKGKSLKEAIEAEGEQQKAMLEQSLREGAGRDAYEKRLAELAIVLDAAELASYEPTMEWHSHAPSRAQMDALERSGVDTLAITSKGLASEVLAKIAQRRTDGRATIKQVRYARRLGHPEPETLTFLAATAWINEHARARAA